MWQHEDRLMELRYFACMSGCCTRALKNEVRVAPTKRPVGDVMDELSVVHRESYRHSKLTELKGAQDCIHYDLVAAMA